jgi:hypothetical protein
MKHLAAAWPDAQLGPGTQEIYAKRLVPWELGAAERAVERLIDSCRRFPSVVDLREAYMAEGGDLPDPGRNMSPRVDPDRPDPTPEERVTRHERFREFREQWRRDHPPQDPEGFRP